MEGWVWQPLGMPAPWCSRMHGRHLAGWYQHPLQTLPQWLMKPEIPALIEI